MKTIGLILGGFYLLILNLAVYAAFFSDSSPNIALWKGELEVLCMLGLSTMLCFLLGCICDHFKQAPEEKEDRRWVWDNAPELNKDIKEES